MKLRELRCENRITQHKLAELLGVSSQTILNWENGIFEPKIRQLIKLADIFNVSVDYLIERKSPSDNIDYICDSLQKISNDDLINFIRTTLEKYNK